MTTTATPAVERATGRGAALAAVDRLSRLLDRRSSRRGFLSRVAVVGSALAVAPAGYVLRPGTAYANVCGTDASCSSGFTVFCATINNGVNRCPPNALVGGWWKADNSGFCCGSARYYIDCHSYCSCGCGGGSRFCGEGCRSCSCGCGPGSSCDQRRVCCNNFRYGQCMQHVSCTGPVWCRVVTCTPPWQVAAWRCTSSPATDNRTGAHTTESLPGCTPVQQKYTAMGGQGGVLGEPTTREAATPDRAGSGAHFDHGSIYTHPQYGTHAVSGAIRAKWAASGWQVGPYGWPTTSEIVCADGIGCFNHFRGATSETSIYWHPQYGAQAVSGAIRSKWASTGWERGPFGYPTTSEIVSADGVGCYNHFRGPGSDTSIFWHPQHGAQAVSGAIRSRWAAAGWERGPYGYPTTSEVVCPDRVGCFNEFAGPTSRTSIYWHPRYGAHGVSGAIRDTWTRLQREAGPLGYPMSSEQLVSDGRGSYNDFVGPGGGPGDPRGSIYWSAATGAWSVLGRIRTGWLARGGATGPYGYPVSDPRPDGANRVRSDFQRGYATEDTVTGQVTFTAT